MEMTGPHLSPPLLAKGGMGHGDRLRAQKRWPELTAALCCAQHPGKNQRLGTALLPSVEFL